MTGADFAAAAQALAGTRFRLHGRDPATGLDCLGLIGAALRAAGRHASLPRHTLPRHTLLHQRGLAMADQLAAELGLLPANDGREAGDVLLVLCSPIQPHLAVALAGERVVHAHAGLGRVVVGPRDPAWTIARHWRFSPAI